MKLASRITLAALVIALTGYVYMDKSGALDVPAPHCGCPECLAELQVPESPTAELLGSR